MLLKGDREKSDNETAIEIIEVKHTTEVLTTYNLEVANAHTFFVGEDGTLVHNAVSRGTRNKVRNNNIEKYGRLTCNVCKKDCVLGKRHQKGVTPPDNEAHMGHQRSRANGGTDTEDNLEVECRACNLANGKKNR